VSDLVVVLLFLLLVLLPPRTPTHCRRRHRRRRVLLLMLPVLLLHGRHLRYVYLCWYRKGKYRNGKRNFVELRCNGRYNLIIIVECRFCETLLCTKEKRKTSVNVGAYRTAEKPKKLKKIDSLRVSIVEMKFLIWIFFHSSK